MGKVEAVALCRTSSLTARAPMDGWRKDANRAEVSRHSGSQTVHSWTKAQL